MGTDTEEGRVPKKPKLGTKGKKQSNALAKSESMGIGVGAGSLNPYPERYRIPAKRIKEGNFILTTEVAELSFWVFAYKMDQRSHLYVMHCPSPSCVDPIFSRDPLENDRAALHLTACGQPFTDQRDMISRYAKLGKGRQSLPAIPGGVEEKANVFRW